MMLFEILKAWDINLKPNSALRLRNLEFRSIKLNGIEH